MQKLLYFDDLCKTDESCTVAFCCCVADFCKIVFTSCTFALLAEENSNWTLMMMDNDIIETVVLLFQRKADDYVEVELELDELDVTSAESKVTYKEIQ